MREAQLILERMRRPESPAELMAHARVLFEMTDLSRPAEVLNLLGGRIMVDARAEFDTLFVGFGMDRIEGPHPGGWRVHCLHLRAVNPASLPRNRLRELVERSGGFDYSRRRAGELAASARETLEAEPANAARRALEHAIDYSVQRDH